MPTQGFDHKDTEKRRKQATARFMLRVIAADRRAGVKRPDADAFEARMKRQAETGVMPAQAFDLLHACELGRHRECNGYHYDRSDGTTTYCACACHEREGRD